MKTAADYRSNWQDVKDYELPNGPVISVSARDCFLCPEPLFKPSLVGLQDNGVAHIVASSAAKVHQDLRGEMLKNIVVTGGPTLFSGFAERLRYDVSDLVKSSHDFSGTTNVLAPPERKYSAWIGGAVLASSGACENDSISKAEYDENGPSIVHTKCRT